MDLAEIFTESWRIFVGRFFLNLLFLVIVSRFFYYSKGKGKREYLFAYITVSTIIFLVCVLISQVKVELGIALGLFAVFSLIRFRSVQASPRELSYLVVCMGISLLYGLLPLETPFLKLIANGILIIATIGIADYLIFPTNIIEKEIIYDRPDLLADNKKIELETDLRTRFGITSAESIQSGNIDTLKGKVKLKIRIRNVENKHFQE
jgi:hypothetical protein